MSGKTTVQGENEIDVIAGNEIRNPEYGFSGLTTTSGNAVSIGNGVTVQVNDNIDSDIVIAGNTVDLGASTLQPTGNSAVDIIAANSYQSDGIDPNTTTMSLDSSNIVTMNGTNASANYLKVYSGKTTLNSATLKTSLVNDEDSNTNLSVIAANGSLAFDDDENYQGGMSNTANNTLTLKNSTIDGANGVVLTAGKIDMDKTSTVHADADNVTVTAQDHNITTDTAKNITAANGTVNITPEPKEPTPEPTPEPEPEPNPEPTPVAPSEDLNKAVQQGNETMTKTLNDANDKSTAVQAQAEELNKSDVSDDQKMAQVAGYTQAIRNDNELSSSEQDALVKTVINTVEPSHQATVDTKNKQDQANQNEQAKAQTGDVQDTTVIVIPEVHNTGVSTVTVDGQTVE